MSNEELVLNAETFSEKEEGVHKIKSIFYRLFAAREVFMIFLILISGVILSIISPFFLTYANIRSISIGMVPNAIIAIGMTVLLVSGVFDLSVGGIMAMTGTIVGLLMLNGLDILPAVLLTLMFGIFLGACNGTFITKMGVNPLIATFAMLSITRSISLILTDGYSVTGLPQGFDVMGTVNILGFPLMVWVMLILVVLGDILLRKSRYLRQVFFIGGNEQAAILSGIKADRIRIVTFIISALFASIAGIILASRLMSGTPTAGAGIELSVIAAAVIGGASLNGGEGTIMGAFLGVVFLTLIQNALVIMSASVYWHGIVNGLILLTAVSIDMWVRRRKSLKA